MAISGAGGWTPSFGVAVRSRKLQTVGYTQNKPPQIVFMPKEVLEKLLEEPDAIIQLDAHYPNFLQLTKLLLEKGLIDDSQTE